MRKILTTTLLAAAFLTSLNAGDKFSDLSKDYLEVTASTNVKKVIAQDPETSKSTLELLTQDSNKEVREFARKNLN